MNFDRINELYTGEIFSKETQVAARERIHWICSQIRGKRILDIGCSQGITCLLLAREGFHCIGVDLEKQAIDYAVAALQKEGDAVRERVEFRVEDAAHLSFPDGSFDTIILGEVLEHLTHPEKILREAKRLLKGEGRVIITVPFGLNDHPDHKRSYYPISFLEAVRPFFRTSLLDALNENIIYCGTKDGTGQLPRDSQEDSLLEELRLRMKTEEKFLIKERHCLDRLNQLNDRIKALNENNGNLLKMNLALKDDLEKCGHENELQLRDKELAHREEVTGKEAELKELELAKVREVEANRRENEGKLKALEQVHREAIAGKEAALKELEAEKIRELEASSREHEAKLRALEQAHREEVTGKEAELKELELTKVREVEANRRENEGKLKALEQAHREKLIRKEAEVKVLEARKTREDEVLRQEYGNKLKRDLAAQAEQFRRAHRWRIGSLFVEPWILAARILKNPFRKGKLSGGDSSDCRNGSCAGAVPGKAACPEVKPGISSVSLQAVRKRVPSESDDKVPIGCICDEFTSACFQPECRMITFRPDNWKETLEREEPRAVFVESAWSGNEGSWQYRVAKYQRNMGDELLALLNWAREKGIPSIFWNKEDPVHFDRFIEKAAFFDYVFTSDADCIPRYRDHLGHSRVYALPFAAQPSLHNPVLENLRKDSVCFAGTYYRDRHEQRREDMDHILKPALDYGLDIYDRQHGLTGKQAELFRFPDIYQSSIRGRLDYCDMVKAYKKYKVFLNVNSVKNSPTMFSRRVYELLACGTPVISTYSKGIIDLLGEDTVFISESEKDTKKYIEYLLGDDEAWMKASVKGIRKVLGTHSYSNRLNFVLEQAGIKSPLNTKPMVTLLVKVSALTDLNRLADMLNAQSYRHFNVVAVSGGNLPKSFISKLKKLMGDIKTDYVDLRDDKVYGKACLNSKAEFFAVIEAADYYGPEYLQDFILTIGYSDCGISGKHSYFSVTDCSGDLRLNSKGYDFHFVKSVPSATLFIRKGFLNGDVFYRILHNRDFKDGGTAIFSIDRFNYVQAGSEGEAVPGLLSGSLRRVEI
jgi:spore maturation protein CgeB/ubiquinone/menaquinone biosynthesis C-methylase UbiE